jgi:hypothetical protein
VNLILKPSRNLCLLYLVKLSIRIREACEYTLQFRKGDAKTVDKSSNMSCKKLILMHLAN